MLLLLCASISASASAQKGSVFVFGNFSANTTSESSPNSNKIVQNTFGINPGIGYQVSDKWTLGIQGSFNYIGRHPSPSGNTSSSGIGTGGGLFARYTIPLTSLLFLYTQAGSMYSGSRSYENGVESPGSNAHSFLVMLAPGIGMNIKNGYALNFGFGNLHYIVNQMPSNGGTISNLGTSFGQSFSFGITKNFTCHKSNEVTKP